MNKKPIACGAGGISKIVTGEVVKWRDVMLDNPMLINEKIVYNKENLPCYRAAFLADHGAKAVLMAEGGKNYHPLILLNDANVPAIAGIGNIHLDGKTVTINCKEGTIYEGEYPITIDSTSIPAAYTDTEVYVNVGYPTSIKLAHQTGADGIGLIRTEFTAVRTLSKILDKEYSPGLLVKDMINASNEADVIYAIAKHDTLKEHLRQDLTETILSAVECFGNKEIIIRTLDIARELNEPMGNRGIRRCISEGGNTIKLLAGVIKDVLDMKAGQCTLGVFLPLVSHYSQIKTAVDIFLSSGLTLAQENVHDKYSFRFGWEIEQPAAALNNDIWLDAFKEEYGRPPHLIGIGTNDLTQFTVALGRDVSAKENDLEVKNYLKSLYSESDFSIIRQIFEVSKQCKRYKTKLFLVGQATADPDYAALMLSFGIIPSVDRQNVSKVKNTASLFEKNLKPDQVIGKYITTVCNQYPIKVRNHIKSKLEKIFFP